MLRAISWILTLSMLGGVSGAQALEAGRSMLALELTSGTADLSDFAAGGGTTLGVYSVPEVGLQAQYWRLMSSDYAVTVSAGVATSRLTLTTGSPAGESTVKTSSFNVRLGGDRMIAVGERTLMYGGPGLEYWVGRSRFGDFTTSRIGLSARLGAAMMLGSSVGVTAHVGHRIGWAKSDPDLEPTKATWLPSSFEGAMGFLFAFGGAP